MKAYRDFKNSLDTALEQGFEQGHTEGMEKGILKGRAEGLKEGINNERIATAKRMLAVGFTVEQVSIASALPYFVIAAHTMPVYGTGVLL